jgi:hypothetical protein
MQGKSSLKKAELLSLVDAVFAVWPSDQIDRKAVYRVWWRYLADIDFSKAQVALDAHVLRCVDPGANDGPLRGSQRPTPGDIRRAVIDEGHRTWPTADEAWSIAEDRIHTIQSGGQAPALPDPEIETAIGASLKISGVNRHAFFTAWRTISAERAQARYGVADDAPSFHTE